MKIDSSEDASRIFAMSKKIETDEEPLNESVLDNIKEVSLFKKGKLKTTLAKDFLKTL